MYLWKPWIEDCSTSQTSTWCNSTILAPLSLKILSMVALDFLFQTYMFHWILICREEMGTIFPQHVDFSTIQESELVWPNMYHYFILKNKKWYQQNFSPYHNKSNRFHLIWIFLSSYIHVLSRIPIWDKLFRLVKNPNLYNMYLQNYKETRAKKFTKSSSVYPLFPNWFLDLEPFPKKLI